MTSHIDDGASAAIGERRRLTLLFTDLAGSTVLVRAAEAGWTVVQVDVPYRPRAGRSKVTGTPLGVVRAVHDMTRVLAR